jgi:cobalamin biosynthesis Mg chelatase CobN
MTLAERRSTIAHELEHLNRGPAPVGYERREELAVCKATAERLISFEALVDAMVWAGDEYELAAELWVDVGTVRDRLRSLSPWESAEIIRRMEQAELRQP